MQQPEHAGFLQHAEGSARAAGMELLKRAESWLAVDSSEGRDVKLSADRGAEAILARNLAPTGLPVFSEETGWIGGGDGSGDHWLVDPLDGTANYGVGVPLCCVSVALMSAGRPVVGVVYDFNRDEMFAGARGQGAWLNGSPIHVSAKSATDVSILATGLPIRSDYSHQAMDAFARDIPRWKKVRMIGSAALSLAYVAAGRFDVYRESSIMMWDVAAGWALVEAAGGVVHANFTDLSRPIDVTACNPRLSKAIADG